MRAPFAVLALAAALLAGCTDPPPEAAVPTPTSPSGSPPASSPAAPRPPPSPPPRVVVTNGTLEQMQVNASTTYEVLFLLNATDRVRVNLVFHELQRPAPYGWSGQVSLRGPDGQIVADSGTTMPESGAAFTLVLRDLGRTEAAGPGEFLARVHASHPTTLTARAYVDEAAGPS